MKSAGEALERFIEGNIFFPETEFIQERSAVGLAFEAPRGPKEFVTLEGAGHNDTYFVSGQAYFEKLSSFISALTGAANPFILSPLPSV